MTNERRKTDIRITAWMVGWAVYILALFFLKGAGWPLFWQGVAAFPVALFFASLTRSLLSALAPWAPEE